MTENEIKAVNFDEIVFEKRNKLYGAYILRRIYKKNVTLALSIALLILLITVGVPFINALGRDGKKQLMDNSVELNLMDVKAQKDEAPPPPPPPPPPSLQQQVQKMAAPVVVDSVEEEVEIATTDDMIQTTSNEVVQEEVVEVVEEVKEVVEEAVVEFFLVEEKPEYPGGEEALLKYLAESAKYPEIAKENDVQGKVFVSFVINQDGKVEQVRVARGVDPALDDEALRVVRNMPSWKPGKQGGKAVRVSYVVPINFKLQ